MKSWNGHEIDAGALCAGPGRRDGKVLTDLLRGFAAIGVARRVVVGRADPQLAEQLGAEVVKLSNAFKPRLVAKLVFYLRGRRWLREHAGEPTLGWPGCRGRKS